MTEDEAKALIVEVGGLAALDRMSAFLALVVEENERQNLVAPSTLTTMWSRHAADSVQLIRFTRPGATSWLDIGTGGGFPGLAVALVTSYQVTLVEPRRRRAEFLASCVARFGVMGRVVVKQSGVEQVHGSFDIISARAVAPVRKLLQSAAHCGNDRTQWLLPRGRLTEDDDEVLSGRRAVFHVEQSLTDAASSILVIEGIGG